VAGATSPSRHTGVSACVSAIHYPVVDNCTFETQRNVLPAGMRDTAKSIAAQYGSALAVRMYLLHKRARGMLSVRAAGRL
jgi:hypothetical protein